MNNSATDVPQERPVFVYDGDCGFCKYWVARWRVQAGDAVAFVPYQEFAPQHPTIPEAEFAKAAHFIGASNEVQRGAASVFRLKRETRRNSPGWWAYQNVPGFASLTERVYGFVARHRNAAAKVNSVLWGLQYQRPAFYLGRWLFLRALGLVLFVAFLSLYVQIDGLIGVRGILPAQQYLDAVEAQLGGEARWRLPAVFWWTGAGNGALHAACWLGMFASLLVIAGVLAPIMLAAAWLLYLSLYHAGQDFLGFQWDILLLETTLLATFFAPLQLAPRLGKEAPPSPLFRFLLWWLLFRLMFSSGFVKLPDETWRDLTALAYHYETQPLPNAIAWYVHQLPLWFHKLSVVGMFAVELCVAFLIFAPRHVRHAAGVLLIGLQLTIQLTGNYGFFNMLSIALCLLLFDDQALRAISPSSWRERLRVQTRQRRAAQLQHVVSAVAALAILLLSAVVMLMRMTPERTPPILVDLYRMSSPFNIVGSYGLFANMTTERPEIIVEGTNDGGQTWRPYRFKWKPGELDRRPRWNSPHQPRLDWQMWFAALGGPMRTHWFDDFLYRLLEESPDVMALLAEDPFPEGKPNAVRAVLYDYEFSEVDTLRGKGHWWQRNALGLYFPPVKIERGRLALAQ
ncbi:MAG: lipase maturation factor family protein [Candidatus Hydrogenedentales bacterium]